MIRTDDERDDQRMEYAADLAEERAARNAHRCVCGDDLPGRCPGRSNCPYSGDDAEGGE